MEGKHYWLISAPKTREDTYNTLDKRTNSQDLSTNYKFNIPDLKVGTLDSLMGLSDSLDKSDTYTEQITRKIALQLFDVLDVKEDKATSKADSLAVNNMTVDQYLQCFKWDEAKYATNQPLKTLTELIQGQVGKLDEELRGKAAEYNNVMHSLAAEERKAGGNLLSKDLAYLAEKLDPSKITDTEYMETIFVAVPKFLAKQWETGYEKLTDFVVPRSSEKIDEDAEFHLYSVTLFRRVSEDFKNICRERKFTPRDYSYDPTRTNKADKKKLEADKERIRKGLIRWCKTNFSEAFAAWTHLKAIRVFVESVLRYGLPTNFQAILIFPHKNKQRKLRVALNELFSHLSAKSVFNEKGVKEEEEDTGGEQFYPYVSLDLNIDFQKTSTL